jgi:hypothetical protein
VLGVQPTSPGFATFSVTPHPSGLTSAQGVVPTPRGPIRVSWSLVAGKLSLQVTSPPGTFWENAPAPTVRPPLPTRTTPAAAPTDSDGTDDDPGPPPDDTTAPASGTAQNVVQQVGRQLRGAWHAAGGW